MRIEDCRYLNDIKGCAVTAVFEGGDFVEIEYLKEGMRRSLSMHRIGYDEANVAVACALLHDVLEDTDTTMGTGSLDIPNIRIVLQGVWALTKNEEVSTKQEQMQESLERLQQQPKCVQMVKLADCITNLAPAPDFWNEEKRKNYVQEAQEILDTLRGCNPYLEDRLQERIDHS